MKSLKNFIERFILSDALPIEARRINMVLAVGMGALIVDEIIQVFFRAPNPMVILSVVLIFVVVALSLYLANRFKIFKLATWFILIIVCNIIFPLIFFLLGGMNSGMPAFFALTIVLTFILSERTARIVMLAIHLAIIICCYYVGYIYPDLTMQLFGLDRVVDQVQGIVVTGFCLGLIYVSQTTIETREREKTARLLTELEQERLTGSALLDANPDFCLMMSDQFEVIDCNMTAIKMLGLSDKETFKKEFLGILQKGIPEVQPDGTLSIPFEERVRRTIEEGSIRFDTSIALGGQARMMDVTMHKVPFRDSFAIMGYLSDVTKFYEAQHQLLQHEKRLAAVNSTAEILISADESNLKAAVETCMGLLGEAIDIDRIYIWRTAPQEGEGWFLGEIGWESELAKQLAPVASILPNYPYIDSNEKWQQILQSGENLNVSVSSLSPEEAADFVRLHTKVTGFIPICVQGEYWGFVSYDDCRSDKAYSQDEITMLESCTILMANALVRNEAFENLARAREEALRGTKAKSDFLANMSHEIRTPLNAVIGMTSIGLNSADSERKDYCFGRIEDASTHLLGVINDILDMSKIEADKLELSEVPFGFESMLQHVVGVSTFRIDEKNQHFMVYLDEKIPSRLVGDDQRLAQVLTNLLSNAVKFTPDEGSISLNARLEEIEADGFCRLRFEVRDTGIGISDEQKSKLFASFQQADNSTSRHFGGTGLGLAISKRIVELMGGEIWVESEIGKGSAFIFTVRLAQAADATESPNAKRRERVDFKNIRVLFVDDDPDIREYFSDIASRFGFVNDTAKDSVEAFELIREKGSYDVYFVDWQMPGMDGIELSKRINEDNDDQKVIVMISSYELTSIEEEAKAVGVNRFLTKPLFPSAIADLIAECVGSGVSVEAAQSIAPDDTNAFEGFRVLLAEDVDINREIVMALLEPMALEIEIAVNGRDALEKFCANPDAFDLILMDVQMPEMDGYEATRNIRASDARNAKDIPIIAMTANVFREDVERCLEAGMNQHVGKPLDFPEVVSVLRKYLKKAN